MTFDLAAYIAARRVEIDAALEAVVAAADDDSPGLGEAMRYSLTGGGGKRLRPILCLASAEAVGGDPALAMPAACAIEMIHTYSLIHDDLPAMDDDRMRRGRPTLHVVAGEGMAILAGDGLLTEAFHLLAREPADDGKLGGRKLAVIRMVAAAAGAAGMVGGQAIDLATTRPGPQAQPLRLDAEQVRRMHLKKTGALIRAAAAAGAVMGGGTEHQVAAIEAAAGEFGLAFQIVDDVLDVEGAPAEIGKTPGKDAAAGKLTYPALYGLERSREMARECLVRAESALRAAGIGDERLPGIGRWIVERSN